jgi:site-specific DNA-methyltransferase (adenine-specific)
MGKNSFKNKVIKADCLSHLKKLPDKTFDHCITDPPYNISDYDSKKEIGWYKSNRTWRDNKKFIKINENWDVFGDKEYFEFCRDWVSEVCRVTKENGNVVLFGTYHNIYKLGFIVESLNLRIINSIIWYKRNAFPNITQRMFCESTEQMIWFVNNNKKKAKNWIFNYKAMKKLTENKKQMRNMWDIPMTPKKEKMIGKHPAQKPLEVLNRLILGCTKKKDIILDPFSGSGTTAVSAKINNRYYYAIENNNKYFNITKKRLKFANQS